MKKKTMNTNRHAVHEEGGLKHWAADEVEMDTHIACDLAPDPADLEEIDCVDCLRMIIFYSQAKKSGGASGDFD